jgi:hypothetical protein
MAKITPSKRGERETITVKTQDKSSTNQAYKWWLAGSKKDLLEQVLSTVSFLKEAQAYRYRQAGIYARLYGNMPLFNFAGANLNKMQVSQNLPIDRPTMNVVQSCIDTLVSRVTQAKPRPVFLTDNSNYKERTLAKQMNNFINGELYQTGSARLAPLALRDGAALGTGALKVFRTVDKKVGVERTLLTELLVDPNDAMYGDPRQLFQLKLVDKSVLQEYFPEYRAQIEKAQQAFPDNSAESQRTISDQVMVVEAWHLPSGKDAEDGRHSIVCTSGVIFDEPYKRKKFPFAFLHYSPRITGFWGQGLAEQLMGTQVEINKLLMTISQSINLVGVPRVFVEDGSKVVKAHLNNMIGAIVTYRGTKPSYEVAPCVPAEIYDQLQRLVQYAYQQSGVSALAATAQKPSGLNSGEAIRNYDDLQSDRFADLVKRYNAFHVELSHLILEEAIDIAKEDGKYQTVYPNKNATKEIDLPAIEKLEDNPFVIECYDSSSLPREPAGRLEKVVEMLQAGMISPQEGRRLLDYPDIEQVDKLENAGEERILKALDEIVENGKYTPPDPFMDIVLAEKLVSQYYNLYVAAGLEEKKQDLLRDFFKQIQDLKMAATPPAPAMPMPGMEGMPQAVPEAAPVSQLLPTMPVG